MATGPSDWVAKFCYYFLPYKWLLRSALINNTLGNGYKPLWASETPGPYIYLLNMLLCTSNYPVINFADLYKKDDIVCMRLVLWLHWPTKPFDAVKIHFLKMIWLFVPAWWNYHSWLQIIISNVGVMMRSSYLFFSPTDQLWFIVRTYDRNYNSWVYGLLTIDSEFDVNGQHTLTQCSNTRIEWISFAAYCIKHAYVACLHHILNWASQKMINGFMTYLGHCSMANGYSEWTFCGLPHLSVLSHDPVHVVSMDWTSLGFQAGSCGLFVCPLITELSS